MKNITRQETRRYILEFHPAAFHSPSRRGRSTTISRHFPICDSYSTTYDGYSPTYFLNSTTFVCHSLFFPGHSKGWDGQYSVWFLHSPTIFSYSPIIYVYSPTFSRLRTYLTVPNQDSLTIPEFY